MSTRIKDTNKKTGIARRVKENGYTHAKADARKATLRAEAEARQAKYDALPREAKLALCDVRPGNSTRERERFARTSGHVKP